MNGSFEKFLIDLCQLQMPQTSQMKTLLLVRGTRVSFFFRFGELRLAFFLVSPCKQTVTMAVAKEKVHTLLRISPKFHFRMVNFFKKRARNNRTIPKDCNYSEIRN